MSEARTRRPDRLWDTWSGTYHTRKFLYTLCSRRPTTDLAALAPKSRPAHWNLTPIQSIAVATGSQGCKEPATAIEGNLGGLMTLVQHRQLIIMCDVLMCNVQRQSALALRPQASSRHAMRTGCDDQKDPATEQPRCRNGHRCAEWCIPIPVAKNTMLISALTT